MKTALSLGLALTMATFGLLNPSTDAHAANANIPGSACLPYSTYGDLQLTPAEAANIAHVGTAVYNLNARQVYVTCPIVRSPTSSNYSVDVYVDGEAAVGGTGIWCELDSSDYDGTFLGSQSFPTSVTGTFDQFLSVPGDYWSTASVFCSLPPNASGAIYDVIVVQ